MRRPFGPHQFAYRLIVNEKNELPTCSTMASRELRGQRGGLGGARGSPHSATSAGSPPALLARRIQCGQERTRCPHFSPYAEKGRALDAPRAQNRPHSMLSPGAKHGFAEHQRRAAAPSALGLGPKSGFVSGAAGTSRPAGHILERRLFLGLLSNLINNAELSCRRSPGRRLRRGPKSSFGSETDTNPDLGPRWRGHPSPIVLIGYGLNFVDCFPR